MHGKLLAIKSTTVLLIIFDILAVLVVSGFSLLLRFEFHWSDVPVEFWNNMLEYSIINIATTIIVFSIFHLYSNLWRYAGEMELMSVVLAVALTDVIQYIGLHILKLAMPRSYYIIYLFAMVIATLISRFSYRIRNAAREFVQERRPVKINMENVLIFGAGKAGQMLLREIKESAHVEEKNVACILDDNPDKKGSYLMGVPVLGGREMLESAVQNFDIKEIMIAIPSMEERDRRSLVQTCTLMNCKVKILPGIYQLINDESKMMNLKRSLRNVELEDLLGREPVKTDIDAVTGYLKGKAVMVTGGGGSIGSELCRQIAAAEPEQLIILDIYENNAYNLQMELQKRYPELNLRVVIASVRDRKRLHKVFETFRPEIVYHAAAHKHVPLMEDNPWEAIKNNIMGTDIVADEADKSNVKKFVMISTDKAVRPTNIMGASKRICEMVIQSYSHRSKTEYAVVRFGNVLGSNGSVVPLFKKQISEGGPVTVTHPDIIRYFMTIPEAVALVLQAGAYARGGEIFILDMGEPVKILDMAKHLIRLSGYIPDVDIKIEFSGLRPGEKLYEELLMDEEKTETQNQRIFIGQQIPVDEQFLRQHLTALYEAAYQGDAQIRNLVKELVPEYVIKDAKSNIVAYESEVVSQKQPVKGVSAL